MDIKTLVKPSLHNVSSSTTNKIFTFIDLCAGIGAGRIGLEKQGFQCIDFAEINTKAILSYQLLHKEHSIGLGDLCTINISKIQDVDLIIAGFPCQSYSIVGQRKGLQDDRGQIIYAISKILQAKNTPYFILENVKGLININKGKDFSTILQLLQDSGYNVYYKVLNSMGFGIPHSRERVYFVGIRKDLDDLKFVFPTEQKEIYDLSLYFDKTDRIDKNSSQYQTFLKYLNNKYNINKYSLDKLFEEDYLVLDTRQSDLRLYDGYIPTIRKGRQGIMYVYQNELYSLSKNDALRMQGYNETYINRVKDISKSALLEQVGNAMTINVIEAIVRNLKKTMQGEND